MFLLSERVLLLGDGVIFRMYPVAWVCFSLSKPCLGPSTALSQAGNAELQVSASVCCWILQYICTHVWNCSLLLDFQNSLPLSLLLQSKGSPELKSKEWCNIWHELRTDTCLSLSVTNASAQGTGALGICRQVWPLTFGCRDSCVTRIFICSWLWGFASWRVGANGEKVWSPPLPHGPEVKLHLRCFTRIS